MRSIIGKGVMLLIVALYGLSFMMDTGFIPSERVQTHDEIGDKHMQVLLDEGIIDRTERIEHFYSDGLFSVRDGGSILTDRRVIAYELSEDDEVLVYDFAFDDIASVEQVQEGTTLDYAIYVVTGEGEDDPFQLWLPHEHGDADRFISSLQARIQN